jgi:hypothetical protein
MAKPCYTCQHPRIKDIDKELIAKRSCRSISVKYGLKPGTIKNHKNNHLKVIIERIKIRTEAAYEKKAVEAAEKYHDMVYAPAVEKERWAQHRLIAIIEGNHNEEITLSAIREYRGWYQEHAKTEGLYKQDGKNPFDKESELVERIKAFLAVNPHVPLNEVISEFAGVFSKRENVTIDIEQITSKVQELSGTQ